MCSILINNHSNKQEENGKHLIQKKEISEWTVSVKELIPNGNTLLQSKDMETHFYMIFLNIYWNQEVIK